MQHRNSDGNMMIDENEWEKFRGAPSAPFDEPIYVTLNHKSQIYLGRHTYELLGSPSHVELYMHRGGDSILIAPASSQTVSSFPVNQKQVGFVILASPFCRHYKIEMTGTIQFIRPEIDSHRLKLDLNQIANTDVGLRRSENGKGLIRERRV